MFVAPGTMPFGYKLTRQAAQDVARNWWVLLLNGALLVVAGFLIFSIHWTIGSLGRERAHARGRSLPAGAVARRRRCRSSAVRCCRCSPSCCLRPAFGSR
jgi:hypothetical protein